MIKRLIITTIRFYQFTLSALIGPTCRFYPSCSHYAAEAIENHGIEKGLILFIKRFIKCHPFNRGGFDPVPPVAEKN